MRHFTIAPLSLPAVTVLRASALVAGLALSIVTGSVLLADASQGRAFAQAAQNAAPPAALEQLTVATASGTHTFSVEVMRTDEQRARGLMFRRFMPQDRGMLFDFKREQPITMWMRNTYIPLDMVFIARDGTVINVAEDTEPLSERTIASAKPAYSVLEINAGVARKLGIKPGDKVRHAIFK
jgi:uncharacterized membrane protein (UPF0127 family)